MSRCCKERPMVHHRSSSDEWSGSGTVVARGSPKTVMASSNDTLCLSRFSMALSGSQTNPVSGTSFLGPLMVRYANGIVKSLSAPSGFWAAGKVLRRRVVNGQSTREVIVETARRCHAARGGGRWTCKACTRERSRSTSAFDSWRRRRDRKSTRLNSSHGYISYAVFCLKKKKNRSTHTEHMSI